MFPPKIFRPATRTLFACDAKKKKKKLKIRNSVQLLKGMWGWGTLLVKSISGRRHVTSSDTSDILLTVFSPVKKNKN